MIKGERLIIENRTEIMSDKQDPTQMWYVKVGSAVGVIDGKDPIDVLMDHGYMATEFSKQKPIDAALPREAVESEPVVAVDREKMFRSFLECRGIESMCVRCGGFGWRIYGNTATWHGGIAGQMLTGDICDHCWGTGDENRHGVDLRKLSKSKTVDAALLREARGLLVAARCPECNGSGSIAVQVSSRQFVTHEMALDACCPEMEGSLYSDDEWEEQQCQWCDERKRWLDRAARPDANDAEGRR